MGSEMCIRDRDQLETFLKTYPKSAHREEALYLRGLSLWMLKRYDHAAAAYRVLLDAFPKGRHTRMARIREAGTLLFSDQPQPALHRLDELMTDPPDRPEMFGRERAHALVLLVDRQGVVRAANLRGTAVSRRVEELLKTDAVAPKK